MRGIKVSRVKGTPFKFRNMLANIDIRVFYISYSSPMKEVKFKLICSISINDVTRETK